MFTSSVSKLRTAAQIGFALSVLLSAQAVWRSERFADEANLVALAAGWDMTLKLHWESRDKRWNVEAYAANLLKRNVEDLMGVNLIVRF